MAEKQETVPVIAPEGRLQLSLRLFLGTALAGLSFGLAGWIARDDVGYLKTGLACGLIVGALETIIICAHDLMNALERWTGRDIDQDGTVGGEDYEPAPLAERIDRALEYVAERRGKWTRAKLCDELSFFSQSEWADFNKQLIERGIVDIKGEKVLVLNYTEARQRWDAKQRKSFAVLPGGRMIRQNTPTALPREGDG